MERKKFAPEELVLVDTHELSNHERWEPGVYVELLPTGRHLVELMEKGRKVTRAYPDHCVKHAKEAYDLTIHFEVYVDSWANDSDVLRYDGYNAEEEARSSALNWANQRTGNADADVVVDRVVVGGGHIARYAPIQAPKK